MSGRITGVATIRVDGQEYPTERGATLNPGGVNRATKMAGKRVYFNEEPVAPTLQIGRASCRERVWTVV